MIKFYKNIIIGSKCTGVRVFSRWKDFSSFNPGVKTDKRKNELFNIKKEKDKQKKKQKTDEDLDVEK